MHGIGSFPVLWFVLSKAEVLLNAQRDDGTMRELLGTIERWLRAGKRFAAATVLRTVGSAPQPVGTQMLIADDLQIEGAVSGGCVESAVVEIAQQVLRTGIPVVADFGVDDETAWNVGLSCGGAIRVLVALHPAVDPERQSVWHALSSALQSGEGIVWVVRLPTTEGEPVLDGVWSAHRGWIAPLPVSIPESLNTTIAEAYQQRRSMTVAEQSEEYFLDVLPPKPMLLMIGAGFPAFDLTIFGHRLGMETVLIDPRKVFANPERFPQLPDRLFHQWPSEVLPALPITEETYAVVLSHDPKIDDDALRWLLRSPARYIGALGSRKTHQKRVQRLQQQGFTEAELARIAAPIGLPIGAITPAEIAVSIIAEIVAAKYGKTGEE